MYHWPAAGTHASLDASADRPGHDGRNDVPESGYGCPQPIAAVRLICFNSSPGTTQGEAEFVGRLARKYYWHSVAVVTITPQDTRARLRVGRCFAGPVYVMTIPIALASWPYQIAYEWAALAKALTVQRTC